MILQKIPNYIKYIFSNVFFLFLYAFIFRLIFFFFFAQINEAPASEIIKSFFLGVRFDIKLAILTVFPIALLLFIINYRFFKYSFYKKIVVGYFVAAYLIVTLFYFIDFGYYDYLNIRLDAASLRFLSNLKISSQMLMESYPVFKGIIGLLILGFVIYKFMLFLYRKAKDTNLQSSKRKKAFYILFPLLLLSFGIYSSFSHYPLRWSQAFFSKNNAVNQFALNPILYFFDSFQFRNEGVDIEKTKTYFPTIAKHLGVKSDSIFFERKVTFKEPYQQKPNIIFVMLESVGVVPMSYFGNPIQSTPKMDSIFKKSVLFTNFFVHKAGTAGTVFSSITGLPDIDRVRTASRNPMVIDQRIIFDQFTGYKKLYFLGGSANWANIRGIFQSNIKDLKIFEEGSYNVEKRADVWGIDDYELFKESSKELAKLHQQKKPFVAYIQTASNHMPFTVPDKRENFRPIKASEISKETLKNGGFDGLGRLNALRYLDFNVARFLYRAKKAGYYDNTIFVFFGDHDTHMNPIKEFKKEFDLGIELHHVPLFIHAPKYIQPQIVSKFTKLVDIFPTAASLAKINYINYTLGSNALDTLNTSNIAFLYHKFNGEPGIALLKDNFCLQKTLISKTTSLYSLQTGKKEDLKGKYPKIYQQMDSLLNGFYHSTKYLYFNNKKVSEK